MLPKHKQKVAGELAKARKDIEGKLVASGKDVSRHVELPDTGKSREWILNEMERMDGEQKSTQWEDGQLSGAVYRASSFICVSHSD